MLAVPTASTLQAITFSGFTPVDPFMRYGLNEDDEHSKPNTSENECSRRFSATSADHHPNNYTAKYTNRLGYRFPQWLSCFER